MRAQTSMFVKKREGKEKVGKVGIKQKSSGHSQTGHSEPESNAKSKCSEM